MADVLKVIWHCPGLLPKVRLFLWKMVNDALPVKGTCALRMGLHAPSCQICSQEPDLPLHALFHCPFAESFWFASQLSLHVHQLPADIVGLLHTMCKLLQGSLFVSFANHLWALWKCRCSHIYEGVQLSHSSVFKMAENLNRLSRLTSSMVVPRPLKHIWQMEQQNAQRGICCYVDGSFSAPNSGGWAFTMFKNGILVRYEVNAFSAFGTEVYAMQMVVRALLRMGIDTALCFTDCHQLQQILEGCLGLDLVPWQEFHDTAELLNVFRTQPGFNCCYISRENNLESHQLANYARLHRIVGENFTYPSFNILSEDVTGL
ncbi:Ribonuclease H-like superfamily protein [Rhynchospora pubera]|uniref:Ribonuclease H-like superfamily protein n=1 Tax=Rhynchospora pubera TaxID=906938 RepID=A0AAV8C4Z8_9POAL|nr:Ribonuclease H-like superfamily protein [Rhynchospora pubera]